MYTNTGTKEEEKTHVYFPKASVALTRFSIKEKTLFAKRLSFLIKAGLPILESMYLIQKQTRAKGKRLIFDTIIHDVANGQSLHTSLARFPGHFGDFTINIIRIGENAGILSQNLLYLADELSKKHVLDRKVRGALIYPLFITVTTLVTTGLLTVFIFPKIMPIFLSMNIELPLSTRTLLTISTYLKHWGLLSLASFLVALVGFLFIRKRISHLRYVTDLMLLYMPVAGSIARAYNAANFCRTLGILIQSGIHVTEALEITADVTDNSVYKKAFREMRNDIERGSLISRGLAYHSYIFPDILAHLVAIGETSGNLSETLRYLGELYEADVEEKTKNLSNSIEPILLVIMGTIVGFIAVSVIAPIYQITENLHVR